MFAALPRIMNAIGRLAGRKVEARSQLRRREKAHRGRKQEACRKEKRFHRA